MNSEYYKKYLKYKNKYFKLKKLIGGAKDPNIDWGLGIEKEAVLYTNIDNDIIEIFSIGKVWMELMPNLENNKYIKFHNLMEGNNNGEGAEMIEITTIEYKNKSIEESINELKTNIKEFLKVLPSTGLNPESLDLKVFNGEYYKDVNYININNIKPKDTHYIGSLHFNITLPHDITKSPDTTDFIKRHNNFGKLLQLFEPLLCSVFGRPDNKSFLDNQKYAEGSFRPFVSNGTFFLSNNFNKVNSDNDNSSFSSDREINKNEIKFNTLSNGLNSHNIENSFNYTKTNSIGMDFSRRVLDVEKDRNSKYFGFEFRLIDLFPMKYMERFLKLFYLIAFFTETNLSTIDGFIMGNTEIDSPAKIKLNIVIEQMITSLKDGHNSEVNDGYFDILKTLLDPLQLTRESTCYEQLNVIYKELKKYYSDNIESYSDNNILYTYKHIFVNSLDEDDDLPNYNKEIFDKIIKTKQSEINSMDTTILCGDTIIEKEDKIYNKRLKDIMNRMETLGENSNKSITFIKNLELNKLNKLNEEGKKKVIEEFKKIEKLSKELDEINSL